MEGAEVGFGELDLPFEFGEGGTSGGSGGSVFVLSRRNHHARPPGSQLRHVRIQTIPSSALCFGTTAGTHIIGTVEPKCMTWSSSKHTH